MLFSATPRFTSYSLTPNFSPVIGSSASLFPYATTAMSARCSLRATLSLMLYFLTWSFLCASMRRLERCHQLLASTGANASPSARVR
jgi:hypothetical protein